MRKTFALLLAVSLLAALAATAFAATRTVTVGDNYYVRASGVPTVTVKRNDTVKWVWRGDSTHDVKVSSGPVKFSSPMKTSGTYRRKMTRRGTYRIYCTVHGRSDQSMKLVVK